MKTECVEGPEAFENFKRAMTAVVAVPHARIKERIEAHRAESAKNPKKRGPKPRSKSGTQ